MHNERYTEKIKEQKKREGKNAGKNVNKLNNDPKNGSHDIQQHFCYLKVIIIFEIISNTQQTALIHSLSLAIVQYTLSLSFAVSKIIEFERRFDGRMKSVYLFIVNVNEEK